MGTRAGGAIGDRGNAVGHLVVVVRMARHGSWWVNVSLVLGTRCAGWLADSDRFSLLFLVAGCLQVVLVIVLKFIDPGETRRVLGEG